MGGVTNIIVAPSHEGIQHSEMALLLKFAPPSLLNSCLEFIEKHPGYYRDGMECLPLSLKETVQIRCSSGVVG